MLIEKIFSNRKNLIRSAEDQTQGIERVYQLSQVMEQKVSNQAGCICNYQDCHCALHIERFVAVHGQSW